MVSIYPGVLSKLSNAFEIIIEHLTTDFKPYWLYVGTTIVAIEFARRRQWILFAIIFATGFAWFLTHKSMLNFIKSLGSDSFHEATNFDWNEGLFWVQTFGSQIKIKFSAHALILYSIIAIVLYGLLMLIWKRCDLKPNKYFPLNALCASLIIIGSISFSLWGAIQLFFQNSESFEKIVENFDNPAPVARLNSQMNVFLYIGESTTVMNMGLYGYPRDTTPKLDQLSKTDAGFLKFNNVFSTHTHTSPSLLEALSFGVSEQEDIIPINRRKRISLVDVFKTVDIKTELFSNQGKTGTWNQAGSVIFANAKRTFSTDNRRLGNSENAIQKPWDHDFLNKLVTTNDLDLKNSSFTVFHSYSGHGPYIQNIPAEFRKQVDSFYASFEKEAILGKLEAENGVNQVEYYDAAVKYVDFSVSNAIQKTKNSKQPWVFIYASDHGEAIFPNLSHDSSSFVHEMARVPFIMHFNDAALKAHPELFEKYSKIAESANTAKLSQLPATLSDLMGVTFDASFSNKTILGLEKDFSPILVRSTIEGLTAVNLLSTPLDPSLIDKTDDATKHYTASRRIDDEHTAICYHGANSLAKALRGSLVTDCLEIDIVVEDVSTVYAYHPPRKNTGLTLGDVFKMVKPNDKQSYWLDGKNLTSEKSCNDLKTYLQAQPLQNSKLLVEFPTGSHGIADQINACIQDFKTRGLARISYYVSTDLILKCSQELNKGINFRDGKSCQAFKEDMIATQNTGLFSDISFDYRGVKAIEALDFLTEFSWNTWHVDVDEIDEINPHRFRMIILFNDDPNGH